jgi:cell division transport system ATP-binding protein
MVRFDRVALSYPTPEGGRDQDVLHDLSFDLPQGSFTWLLGPSGAGKSSVLRLMHCAMRPSGGEVEVLGVPLSRTRRSALPALRRRIGVVFQDFRLLPYLSVFDNIALPLRLAGRAEASLPPDVTEMLRWVGLDDRADSLPLQLSGGEQQRIAIARAVVTRPELLVADEPTGNLDSAQSHRLIALLHEMNRLGTTVVVATHSEDLVEQWPAPSLTLDRGRLAGLYPAELPPEAQAPGAPFEDPSPPGPAA